MVESMYTGNKASPFKCLVWSLISNALTSQMCHIAKESSVNCENQHQPSLHCSGDTPLLSWTADNVTHCTALRTLSHIVKTNIGETTLLSWPADNVTHCEVRESNVNCENQHQPSLHCSGDLERLSSSRDLPALDFLYSPLSLTAAASSHWRKASTIAKAATFEDPRASQWCVYQYKHWSPKSDGWSGLLVLLEVESQRLSSGLKKPHEEITMTHKSPREILRISDGLKRPIQKRS